MNDPTPQSGSTVQITMQQYAKGLVQASKNFNDKIKTAKTAYKKEFYRKKLKKNNEELSRFLMGLARLEQIEKMKAQQQEKGHTLDLDAKQEDIEYVSSS